MSDSNNSIKPYETNGKSDMSIGDWIITFFGLGIPLIGIICWVMWIGDSVKKPSRRTFLIAYVIWVIILSILCIVFWGTISSILIHMLRG